MVFQRFLRGFLNWCLLFLFNAYFSKLLLLWYFYGQHVGFPPRTHKKKWYIATKTPPRTLKTNCILQRKPIIIEQRCCFGGLRRRHAHQRPPPGARALHKARGGTCAENHHHHHHSSSHHRHSKNLWSWFKKQQHIVFYYYWMVLQRLLEGFSIDSSY